MEKVSGFTDKGDFTDELNALNNRVLNYEIIAYDKLLNKVGSKKLEPVKIQYDGTINKAHFSVNSNMRNEADENEYETENVVSRSVENIIDGDITTVFNGNTRKVSTDRTTPYIVIDLNESLPLCGLRYTAGTEGNTRIANTIQNYNIYVSSDNSNWKKVRSGTFKFNENNQSTVYFTADGGSTENQLYTIIGGYVKIEAVGNTGISGAEIDIITPPGDNIEASENEIFELSQAYQYGDKASDVIPEGSVVIKGTYRGNPAYNVAALANEQGELISLDNTESGIVKEYHSIFTATIPDNMQECPLEEISKGYCIIYMDKALYSEIRNKYTNGIKLNLYRVNNAENNEGQRLVSDTFVMNLPEELNQAVLETGNNNI